MRSSRRKNELIRRGQGWRTSAGEFRARANLLDSLRRQEVERVGRQLAAERGVAFHFIEEGETARGKLLGSMQLKPTSHLAMKAGSFLIA